MQKQNEQVPLEVGQADGTVTYDISAVKDTWLTAFKALVNPETSADNIREVHMPVYSMLQIAQMSECEHNSNIEEITRALGGTKGGTGSRSVPRIKPVLNSCFIYSMPVSKLAVCQRSGGNG